MNKVKLGDIADVQLGKMLDAKKNKGEYHPYLANVHVRWGEFDTNNLPFMRFEENEKERFSLRNGDLVMCEGGEPGRCAIWRNQLPNVYYQKALHRIRPHEDIADARWLYYWFLLQGRIGGLKKYFVETTIKHLVGEDLKRVEIDLPSFKQQKAVADALSALDDKITLNKQMMAELEATARLIYDYWFTQFDFPDENGNPYRSSGGKMTHNKTLNREIPAGWEVVRIGNLFSLQKGYSYSSEELSSVSDNPMISLASIDRKRNYREEELKYLRNDAKTDRVAYPGDLLIACTDLTRNADIVGSPIFVPDEHAKYIFSMDLAKIQTLSSSVTPSYLYEVLRTDWFHNFIKGHTSGTNVIHLDVAGFNWFKVALPPICLQQQYSKLHLRIIEKQNQCRREVAELATLRNWLLPMLMNGQVNTNG